MIDSKIDNSGCQCVRCREVRLEERAKNNCTYEQGFRDGMSINHKMPMTFQFMGYSMDQLIELIREHEEYKFYSGEQWGDTEVSKRWEKKMNEEAKMTRSEAIGKCHGISYPEVLVQALEALGIIKFKDEEENHSHESVIHKSIHRQMEKTGTVNPKIIIAALEAKGYQINQK